MSEFGSDIPPGEAPPPGDDAPLSEKPGARRPEFEMIRSAPQPEPGPSLPPPLVILVVIAALAVGGYFLFAGGDDSEAGPPGDEGGAAEVEEIPLSQAEWDLLQVKEESQGKEFALAHAEELYEKKPSKELAAKIAEYRSDLGLGQSPGQLIAQARSHMKAKEYDQAIDRLTQVIDSEEAGETITGEGYFLRAWCYLKLGRKGDARDDLNAAKDMGYDPKQVDPLLKRTE